MRQRPSDLDVSQNVDRQWGHSIVAVLRLIPDVLCDPEAKLQKKVAGGGFCAFVLLVA